MTSLILSRATVGLTILAIFLPTANLLAHEGHEHAPQSGQTAASGPITISPQAKQNLNLKVEEVAVRTIEHVLTAIGQIQPIPALSAAVSSRIAGRVSALYVMEGQRVTQGQELVEIESRQLGDPPPRVKYKAPFTGMVIDSHVVLGDAVEPNTHIMGVFDPSEVYAEGRIFEGQIASLAPGQEARVSVEAFPGRIYNGYVELLSAVLDPKTGTLKVWVRLLNPEWQLRPNMRATLNIVVSKAHAALAVPHVALLGDSANKFLFVQSAQDEFTFERRFVATGIQDDRYIEILEGVLPTEKVVTEGAYQLQYVAPVKTAQEAPHHTAAHSFAGSSWDGFMLAMIVLLIISNLSMLAILRRQKKIVVGGSGGPSA